MQAKQGDGARRSVCDVLEYLITIPEVKEAIKKDGSKIKLRFAADGKRWQFLTSCVRTKQRMNTSIPWHCTMVSA